MAHLVGLLVGLLQGWLDRHHRPALCLIVATATARSAAIATANMAHLVGLLVGLLQGWLDRHHRPA